MSAAVRAHCRGVDHRVAALAHPVAQHVLQPKDCPALVARDDPVGKVLVVRGNPIGGTEQPGIVEESVDPAVGTHCQVEVEPHCLRVAHVRHGDVAGAARLTDEVEGAIQAVPIDVDGGKRKSCLYEGRNGRPSYAIRGAGDNR